MTGTVAVSERMGSPNKVRIGHLSEKLVSLQDELEHEKQVNPHTLYRTHNTEVMSWRGWMIPRGACRRGEVPNVIGPMSEATPLQRPNQGQARANALLCR